MQKLVPFPLSEHGLQGLDLQASARIERVGTERRLIVEHTLRSAVGGIENCIRIPPPLSGPHRRDELWKHTCFEAFIKPKDGSRYWELNLSPSGEWNVYRFDGYRQGMRPEHETEFTSTVNVSHNDLTLISELWIPSWSAVEQFEIGLTAVLEEPSGQISYWALQHAGPQADFHLAKSFTCVVKNI